MSHFKIKNVEKNNIINTNEIKQSIKLKSNESFVSINDLCYINNIEVLTHHDSEFEISVSGKVVYKNTVINQDKNNTKTMYLFFSNIKIAKYEIVSISSNEKLYFTLYLSYKISNENTEPIVNVLSLKPSEKIEVFDNENYINILEQIFD